YVRAENKVPVRYAPTPAAGLTMTPASPYFPGNGITPAIAGLDPAQNILVFWRTLPLGQRVNEPKTIAERMVADLSGTVRDWDYRTGFFWSKTTTRDVFTGGFTN